MKWNLKTIYNSYILVYVFLIEDVAETGFGKYTQYLWEIVFIH